MNDVLRKLSPHECPVLLREIPDAPETLFLRGVLPPPTHKLLCVVGSRKYSPYGKEVCEKLITGLRGYPITIISGLALGIDSIAHRAALGVGLHTVAVPGSGLGWDVLYPASHRQLAKKILAAGGALLSEFDEHFRATPYSFPQRNRVMAGMSHAVLVIEAEERSGTLITSRLATEYNRDVLTIPGSIFSRNSSGPHMLLRLGATPVRHSEDILDALDMDTTISPDNLWTSDVHRLSEGEKEVVKLLHSPLSKQALVTQLALPIEQVNILLSTMEIKGIIKEQLGEIHLQ